MCCATVFYALVVWSRRVRRSIGRAASFFRRWRATRHTGVSKNLLLGVGRGVEVSISCPLCGQPARLTTMLTVGEFSSASHPIVPQQIWHAAYLKALVMLPTIV